MSINLSNVLVTKFESEVQHVFQEEGILKDTVRVRDARGAQKVQFNLMGKGTTQERGAVQTPLAVANISHTPKVATVGNHYISEMTDIFLNNQVGFDERMELATSIAKALGRRMDQIIIDELDSATLTHSVADTISGSADNLTLAALREAARLLDAEGVPAEDRCLVIHPDGLHHLLADTNVTSSDFATVKALVQGDLDSYYGFNFKKVGNRSEGGLPVPTSNHRSNFFYQKMAVGLAVNMEPRIEINYEPSYGAHRVTGFLSAGAVVVDPDGAGEMITDES